MAKIVIWRRMSNRLKIALLTSIDPTNRRSLSGLPYYMAKSLEKHCGEVFCLGPVTSKINTIGKYMNYLSTLVLKRQYKYSHSVMLSKRYKKNFEKRLQDKKYDLIFSPFSSTEIAFLDNDIPIIYASDATFALLHNYYPGFSNLISMSVREGNLIEKYAIDKSSFILYPSKWAAKSAVNHYKVDEEKIRVYPYGPNIDDVPHYNKKLILKKESSKIKLLFLGVDWQRKGGDIAVETLLELKNMGIDTELTVCGCILPKNIKHENINVIPFLDKNDKKQRNKLNQLLTYSDFLLFPTRAECFGIVFCEANAFGLPVLATRTGGLEELIEEGENGFLFDIDARGIDYAQKIYSVISDKLLYYNLRQSSRLIYEDKYNWDSWGKKVNQLLKQMP
jgi:glycosyltransferase involved in cell wall biosynthesis